VLYRRNHLLVVGRSAQDRVSVVARRGNRALRRQRRLPVQLVAVFQRRQNLPLPI